MAQSIPGSGRKKNSDIQNIKVAVRIRPISDDEKHAKLMISSHSASDIYVRDKRYSFDRVFGPNCTQTDVYHSIVKPMISDVIAGYNCTVFVYGQTGSGKTYTMTGNEPKSNDGKKLNWQNDKNAGCIPRAAAHIFDELASSSSIDFTVRVSYLELYNEEVRDLLCQEDKSSSINIFNDHRGLVCLQNLTEVEVFNSKNIYELLEQGNLKRQTAATLLNTNSSRSHTVFTITVHSRDQNDLHVIKTGKLNLVDLAGSENIAKSGVRDRQAKESANINRSLLTLGRVINTLAEGGNKHIPYRDSKLTRILQDSLGGHTKTCIIATVCPNLRSSEETISTLDYANRARHIKNTPLINEKITRTGMMAVSSEIETLSKQLEAARSGDGFYVDRNFWDKLNAELKNHATVVTIKNHCIEDLKSRLGELEQCRDIKEKEFVDVTQMLDKAKNRLKTNNLSLKQEKFVSKYYLNATQSLSKNQEILQKKLYDQYATNSSNHQVLQQKSTMMGKSLDNTFQAIDGITQRSNNGLNTLNGELNTLKMNYSQLEENLKNLWMEKEKSICDQLFEDHLGMLKDFFKMVKDTVLYTRETLTDITKTIEESCGEMRAFLTEIVEKYEKNQTELRNFMETFYQKIESEIEQKNREDEELLKNVRALETALVEKIKKNDILNCVTESKPFLLDEFNSSAIVEQRKISDFSNKIDSNFEGSISNIEFINEKLLDLYHRNDSQTADFSESTKSLQATYDNTISEHMELVTTSIGSNSTKLDSLSANLTKMQQDIDEHVANLNKYLNTVDNIRKEINQEYVRVNPTGDTPRRSDIQGITGSTTRTVLLERFREESQFNESLNQSIDLNDSNNSILEDLTLPVTNNHLPIDPDEKS